MDTEASQAEADRILSEAGWTTTVRPPWSGHHYAPGLVGGVAPDGTPYAKAFTSFPQAMAEALGHDPADYADTYHEAAAWLVEHAKPKNPLSSAATLEPVSLAPANDQGEPSQDETHSADSEESPPVAGAELAPDQVRAEPAGDSDAPPDRGQGMGEGLDEAQIFDAEFSEPEPAGELEGADLADPPALEFTEEMAEHEEATGEAQQPQDRIYGLDDLDRRRAIAVMAVRRAARDRMPQWGIAEHGALVSRRNFAMGVTEGRWPDDPGQQQDLVMLEETLARVNRIKAAREEKAEFLEGASREEIEAFDPDADWPS